MLLAVINNAHIKLFWQKSNRELVISENKLLNMTNMNGRCGSVNWALGLVNRTNLIRVYFSDSMFKRIDSSAFSSPFRIP